MSSGRPRIPEGLVSTITRALFIRRFNRFVALCDRDGRTVQAYLPNPGRLWELLLPGRVVYLTELPPGEGRKLRYMMVAVERDGTPILLDTRLTNDVARHLIEQGRIAGLEGAEVVMQEAAAENSRFDFLLRKGGRDIYLEVKSCTLAGTSIAMFPDAITARGTRHLLDLAAVSRKGTAAAVLFIVHWPKARYFMPEHHTDLAFSRALLAVKERVMVRAVSVGWEKDLSLGTDARMLEIPWPLVARESHDRGSYIVILCLPRDRVIEIGSRGRMRFRRGYYLYAGSAMANLTKRVERHRRITKTFQWHIDYLRPQSEWCGALPVRTADDIECEIAEALGKIADWTVPGFGSSDCSCKTHLFGMADDPIRSPAFIALLHSFRIDRLEKFLENSEYGQLQKTAALLRARRSSSSSS